MRYVPNENMAIEKPTSIDISGEKNNYEKLFRSLTHAVVLASNAVRDANRDFEAKPGEGHRSGITEGDKRAHELMAEHLAKHFPETWILSEEGSSEEQNMFDTKSPDGILEKKDVVIFDPIDGTVAFANKLGNWSTGAGLMHDGEMVGSVIYAQDVNGGMLVRAEKDNGVYLLEKNSNIPQKIEPTPSHDLKDCMVSMGVDATLYPSLMSVISEIAANIRGWSLANSGLLGLAQVAAGRLQAIVQTPQKPWDWAPAYRAVLESGRVFKFFRLVPDAESSDGTLRMVPVEKYDADAFSSDSDKRLGFVAGEPEIVDYIFNKLPKKGWARFNPDTITPQA